MFDVLSKTYITAARMDHWAEQDFMHRDPRTAARLRHIHGLNDPSIGRALWGRVGMDGPIQRAKKPAYWLRLVRSGLALTGKGMRLAGEWLERTASITPPSAQQMRC